MKNRKVTTNDLAKMVKAGFDGVDKHFEQVDKRFEQVDKRFERLEVRVENGFRNVDARFNMLEKDIKEFVTHDEFEDLAGRVKYCERKLGVKSGKV